MLLRPPGYITTNVAALYGSSGGYSPEAEALFAVMSPAPDATRKALINDFIVGLIFDGIWAKIDAMWVLRAHAAQPGLQNWKNPGTFTATEVNSPTFTVDRGFAGNGSTSHVNSNWNGTDGVNWTQNSACLAVYTNDGPDSASNTAYLCGGGSLSGASWILGWRSTNVIRCFINSGNNTDVGPSSTRFGLTAVNRSGSTAVEGYRNGVLNGTSTQASGTMDADDFFIGAWNEGGVRQGTSTNIIGLMLVGGSMTSTDHANLDTRWDAYLAGTP